MCIPFLFSPTRRECCRCQSCPPDKSTRDRSPRPSFGPIVECRMSGAFQKRFLVGIVPAYGRVRDSTSQRLLPEERGAAGFRRFPRTFAPGWEDHQRNPPWFGLVAWRECPPSKYWWTKSVVSHRMTDGRWVPRVPRQSVSPPEPVPGGRPAT